MFNGALIRPILSLTLGYKSGVFLASAHGPETGLPVPIQDIRLSYLQVFEFHQISLTLSDFAAIGVALALQGV